MHTLSTDFGYPILCFFFFSILSATFFGAGSTVETWDLQKAFIDATGINVDAFFD